MFWWWGKPEYPVETHTNTERTSNLHIEKPCPTWESNPGPFLLWGNSANPWATMQPLFVCVSWRLCSYHLQNGRVATNDEGQTTEALDAMGNSYRQLLVEVLGTALRSHAHTRTHVHTNTRTHEHTNTRTHTHTIVEIKWVGRSDRDQTVSQFLIKNPLGSSLKVAQIFTRMWCPSGDFPEYSRVAKVSRTDAWGDSNMYDHTHRHTVGTAGHTTLFNKQFVVTP